MSYHIDSIRIEKVIKESIGAYEIAGCNLMIIKDGKEIYYHEDGLADIEGKESIKRDTIFRLYSLSKPVTAAAVMILLERGEIDLFEPVSKYLSGFKSQRVVEKEGLTSVNREVMIKDLLSMTSGLVYPGEGKAGQETAKVFLDIDKNLLSEQPLSTLEIANRLGECPLAFQPGEWWEYGSSADVLGAIIEVASGQKLSVFLQEEIFKPLKMKDTGFFVPNDKRSRLAKTYGDNGQGQLELYLGNNLGIIQQMDREPAFESGGAGLVSTIDDYGQFAKMLMNKGSLDGIQILKPKTVEHLTTTTLHKEQQTAFETWTALSGHSYGNLMRVMTDCSKAGILASHGEYGWDGWLGTYLANCPEDDLTILFMTQKKDSGTMPLTRKLRNIIAKSFC